jgi:hypothetical protein
MPDEFLIYNDWEGIVSHGVMKVVFLNFPGGFEVKHDVFTLAAVSSSIRTSTPQNKYSALFVYRLLIMSNYYNQLQEVVV